MQKTNMSRCNACGILRIPKCHQCGLYIPAQHHIKNYCNCFLYYNLQINENIDLSLNDRLCISGAESEQCSECNFYSEKKCYLCNLPRKNFKNKPNNIGLWNIDFCSCYKYDKCRISTLSDLKSCS